MLKLGDWASSARTFASDVAEGFLEITHHSFALLGLVVAFVALTLLAKPELRSDGETQLRAWLQERHVALLGYTPEPEAVERATAANPKELPKDQAAVAYWISKKYRVAPEPIAAIVAAAYEQGKEQRLDPTLILAVMAVESSFNPFAQSSVGAQGLMQVMTRVHKEKYESFGGNHAAFDPVSNMRVGASILREYIDITGSVEGGLKYYVGAANLPTDSGYANKVLAEHRRLRQVAGQTTPTTATKPLLVAKRLITPIDEAMLSDESIAMESITQHTPEALAASSLEDQTQVAANSNL